VYRQPAAPDEKIEVKKSLRPNPFGRAGRLAGVMLFQSMEKAMKRTLIRYKARPDLADSNAELIAAVFAELQDAKPARLRYLALRLEDDSFVHFVATEADDGASALRELPAFQAFQSGIRDRCEEMPLARGARIVGNYRMLETE
jgi:hypothetical protein